MKKLGFGLMRLPRNNPIEPGDINVEATSKMVDVFMERGFTYFDTAWMYCAFQSEKVVKEALVKRYPRDSYTLTTKMHANYIKSKEDVISVFEEQKNKTGVDFFDYYLVHDVNRHSKKVYDELDVWSFVQSKKASGEIKVVGFSYHDDAEFLDSVLTEHPEIELVQLQLNYLDWESDNVQSRKCYEVCVKHGKKVLVMEPVKGGTLAAVPKKAEKLMKDMHPDWSIASWAVRFAASLENVMVVLSGMSNMNQMLDNTAYMQDFTPLNEAEQAVIKEVADIIKNSISIPCTGCSYCTDGCPMNINIPRYFALYNEEKQEGTSQKEAYTALTEDFGKASSCVECKQCEGICPQHLKIVDYLKDVAKEFE